MPLVSVRYCGISWLVLLPLFPQNRNCCEWKWQNKSRLNKVGASSTLIVAHHYATSVGCPFSGPVIWFYCIWPEAWSAVTGYVNTALVTWPIAALWMICMAVVGPCLHLKLGKPVNPSSSQMMLVSPLWLSEWVGPCVLIQPWMTLRLHFSDCLTDTNSRCLVLF